MSNVQFNLQEYLRDMEDRILDGVEGVRDEVRKNNAALAALEKKVEMTEAKLKWVWRAITIVGAALASYFGVDIGMASVQ